MINYIKESFDELRNHVTWPTWAEAQRLTIIVAVFSIIFSLAIWGIDTIFADLMAGKLFTADYYQEAINGGFGSVFSLVVKVLFVGVIIFGLSSNLKSDKK